MHTRICQWLFKQMATLEKSDGSVSNKTGQKGNKCVKLSWLDHLLICRNQLLGDLQRTGARSVGQQPGHKRQLPAALEGARTSQIWTLCGKVVQAHGPLLRRDFVVDAKGQHQPDHCIDQCKLNVSISARCVLIFLYLNCSPPDE